MNKKLEIPDDLSVEGLENFQHEVESHVGDSPLEFSTMEALDHFHRMEGAVIDGAINLHGLVWDSTEEVSKHLIEAAWDQYLEYLRRCQA